MSRKLSYNGKELSQMTKQELQEQYEANKKRLAIRSGVFGAFTLLSLPVLPIAAIVPAAFGCVTGRWLNQNNKKIQGELEKR